MQNDIAHLLSRSEVSWQLMFQDVTVKCIGFLTLETLANTIYTFILSQKTKRSVLEAEWLSRAGRLQICQYLTGQKRTKTGQGRAGQGSMTTLDAAFLYFSPSYILVYY